MTDHDDLIDEKLRAAFAPPPPEAHVAAARAAIGQRVHRPRWPWLVAAAAAIAVLAGLLATSTQSEPVQHDGRDVGAMWVAAYEHALAKGDAGSFCCDPSSDFARTCEQRFAARIVLGASPTGGANEIAMCGCYCGLPIGDCVAALARTPAGPIGIFAMPRAADPAPQLPPGSDLRLARRELGSVVLYALSNASPTQQLEHFRLAP